MHLSKHLYRIILLYARSSGDKYTNKYKEELLQMTRHIRLHDDYTSYTASPWVSQISGFAYIACISVNVGDLHREWCVIWRNPLDIWAIRNIYKGTIGYRRPN